MMYVLRREQYIILMLVKYYSPALSAPHPTPLHQRPHHHTHPPSYILLFAVVASTSSDIYIRSGSTLAPPAELPVPPKRKPLSPALPRRNPHPVNDLKAETTASLLLVVLVGAPGQSPDMQTRQDNDPFASPRQQCVLAQPTGPTGPTITAPAAFSDRVTSLLS